MAIHPKTGAWFDETIMHCTECGRVVEDQDEPGSRFVDSVSDPEHGEIPVVEVLCKALRGGSLRGPDVSRSCEWCEAGPEINTHPKLRTFQGDKVWLCFACWIQAQFIEDEARRTMSDAIQGSTDGAD